MTPLNNSQVKEKLKLKLHNKTEKKKNPEITDYLGYSNNITLLIKTSGKQLKPYSEKNVTSIYVNKQEVLINYAFISRNKKIKSK